MVGHDENKVIFFDIGGTLIGSPDLFYYIASKYENGDKDKISKVIREKYDEIYANKDESAFKSVNDILKIVLKEVAVDMKLEDLSSFSHEYYENFYFKKAYLYDDVLECLTELKKKKVKLIVLSDSDSDILIGELKKLDIYKYFDGFVISGDVNAYKPADKIINTALNFCNVRTKQMFMVGNSDMDILSAEKMKATSILINRRGKKINYKSEYTITSLNELIKIIYH